MSRADVVVVGGGLAGLAAALDLADAGASVTLVERRARLGGLTWSFEHAGRQVDNGQHVFLRCCDAYLGFLRRIGSERDVELQDRLDITALRPVPGGLPETGRLRRLPFAVPAPLHLGPSLLRYRHIPWKERLVTAGAALALRRLDLADPSLDTQTFGAWLAAHGQGRSAAEALWDLVTMATVNLPSAEASLTMGAMVFKTGLLVDAAAADVGWSRIPLGRLHGERAAEALAAAGVEVRLGRRVGSLAPAGAGWALELEAGIGPGPDRSPGGTLPADAVVVAVPHHVAAGLLPPGSVPHQDRLGELGTSAIVNVHVVFDRPVTDRPFVAGVGTGVQWVFDRTGSSGMAGPGQYLAVTISAADRHLGRRPDELAAAVVAELRQILPAAGPAEVLDTLVTKERTATFRATPGSARLRPRARTAHEGLAVAGSWTDTGWPATMEGAIRSGRAAARAILGPTAPPAAAPDRRDRPRLAEEVA